jgi:plastocyanin domain-containing protein
MEIRSEDLFVPGSGMRRALIFLMLVACKSSPGAIDVQVTAKGFEPDRIEVAAGKPVTLRFTRQVAETCADAVDVQGDPVRHMLPLKAPVEIRLTAPASGQIAFACPMQMYRGAVVVVGQ